MKPSPSTMSDREIERELENFAWEYIAAADKAQTDSEYTRFEAKLDERKKSLFAEIQKRKAVQP